MKETYYKAYIFPDEFHKKYTAYIKDYLFLL